MLTRPAPLVRQCSAVRAGQCCVNLQQPRGMFNAHSVYVHACASMPLNSNATPLLHACVRGCMRTQSPQLLVHRLPAAARQAARAAHRVLTAHVAPCGVARPHARLVHGPREHVCMHSATGQGQGQGQGWHARRTIPHTIHHAPGWHGGAAGLHEPRCTRTQPACPLPGAMYMMACIRSVRSSKIVYGPSTCVDAAPPPPPPHTHASTPPHPPAR